MSDKMERKIAQARVQMMFDTPFFGHLAINLQPKQQDGMKMPTMATDGTYLFYDEKFVKDTSLEHLKFIIAHEVIHIVLWHIPRLVGREPDMWNIAADIAGNDLIMKDFPNVPPGVLIPATLGHPEWENKTADFIYANLPDDGKGGKGTGLGNTLDDHGQWGNWGKDPGKDGKDGQGKDGQGKDDGLAGNSGIEQQWREKLASAAVLARQKGKLPGHLEELVGEILQPKLSWRAILRDMVTSASKNDFRWNPPNKKHLYRGFILPGITGEEIKVAAAVDTSGSIGSKELAEFLAEIEGICQCYDTYTLHLFACDAQIHKYWELHEMDPIPRNMPGRGGTSFAPVIDDLKEGKKEFSVLVYLTDLCGDQHNIPDPGFPVIWVCIDENGKAPWGKVIYLPPEK